MAKPDEDALAAEEEPVAVPDPEALDAAEPVAL
jgi:hypothetical protein